MSLFIAGFFARSFARKLIDIDYHIAMGGNAYSSLADSMQRSASGRSIAAIYAELAQKFQRLVDALNEVSEMSYVHTDADILRLYEIWMKTGSPRAHGLLNRLGVQPVRQGGLARPSTRAGMVLQRTAIAARDVSTTSSLGYDVYDFLVTDRRALAGVAPGQRSARARKRSCCSPRRRTAPASRCTSTRACSRAWSNADPLGALTEGNLADYCTALEGVSHFVYSTWRLDGDAPVSLLELETQAEVDKYAATVFLVADQQGGGYPAQVHARLFDRVDFDARLEPEQFDRYRTAHRCAANFCRRLEQRFVSRGERAGSRRWCASCANSIAWEAPRSSVTRCPESARDVLLAAAARPRLAAILVLVALGLLLELEPVAELAQIRLSSAAPRLAELAAVVGVVALHGAQGVRLAPLSSGVGASSASDSPGFSSFFRRSVETSRPKAPVATDHSQIALPRSSNCTRPVCFFARRRSASAPAGLARRGAARAAGAGASAPGRFLSLQYS